MDRGTHRCYPSAHMTAEGTSCSVTSRTVWSGGLQTVSPMVTGQACSVRSSSGDRERVDILFMCW